ncbi:MAG: hypothetical protein K2K92_08330 [Duncaniella sp.]|nr:hypothetical protein [Duncaniella sp.]
MRNLVLAVALLAVWVGARAEVVPTGHGAKITIDSVTTEVIVMNPQTVQVVKYINGQRPRVKNEPKGDGALRRDTGHNKYKIDTGDYYVALNEKDGNVSFWSHGDTLIMAEQHKTGRFAPISVKGDDEDGEQMYAVSQDFQIGKSGASTLSYAGRGGDRRRGDGMNRGDRNGRQRGEGMRGGNRGNGQRGEGMRGGNRGDRQRGQGPRGGERGRRGPAVPMINLMDSCVVAGSPSMPSPVLMTDKGYIIDWQTEGQMILDATPQDKAVRKPGDVTLLSAPAPYMSYIFICRPMNRPENAPGK